MSTGPTLRRSFWAYQIAAVCLLLLAASPFTAPFATCDFANGVLHLALDEGADSVKAKLDDDTAIPVFADLIPSVFDCPAGQVSDSASRLTPGAGPGPFPLRL
jgi:hypothetical protein